MGDSSGNVSDSVVPSLNFQSKLMKSSFRVPLELIKKNYKIINKTIERQNQTLLLNINKLIESDPPNKLESFRKILSNYEAFHVKLTELTAKHNDYVARIDARFGKAMEFEKLRLKQQATTHLNDDLNDWYREQIDLMICEYLIRTGNVEVGYSLLKEKKLDKLVDCDVIEEGLHIYKEIKENKNLNILVEWCNTNKKSLTKLNNNNNLEFETYFQKFIELLKEQKIFESIELSKKYLIGNVNKEQEINLDFTKPTLKELVEQKTEVEYEGNSNEETERETEYLDKLISASRLLLFDSLELSELFGFENSSDRRTTQASAGSSFYSKFVNRFRNKSITSMDYYDPYSNEYNELNQNFLTKCLNLYSSQKWSKLANFFIYNFNKLYGVNQNLEFLIMLSTGISALKTKSCNHDLAEHKEEARDTKITFDDFLDKSGGEELLIKTLNNCPICSLELKQLSKSLPFSHQIVSNIFHNPVMLPNGNIYQLNKLLKINENLNVPNVQTVTPGERKKRPFSSKNTVRLYSSPASKKVFRQIYSDDSDSYLMEKRSARSSVFGSSGNRNRNNNHYDVVGEGEEEDDDEGEESNQDSISGDETAIARAQQADVDADAEMGDLSDPSSADASGSTSWDSISALDTDSDQETIGNGGFMGNGTLKSFFEQDMFSDDLIFEDLKYLGNFKFKDPLSNEIFSCSDLVKVFPT